MPSGNIRVTAIRTNDARAGSPTPPSQQSQQPTKVLDLLRFIALSTSVHADAVQATTDASQSALLRMRSEEETLNHLDGRLQALLTEQRRLHAMRDAIAQSKESRRRTDALLQEQEKRLKEEADRARGPHWKRMQSSQHHQRERAGVDGAHPVAATEDSESLERREEQLSALDEEVERTRRLVAETNRMSIRAKLLELETLKQSAREIDGRALMKDMVVGFHFPEEVEKLWGGEDESDNEATATGAASALAARKPLTSTTSTRRPTAGTATTARRAKGPVSSSAPAAVDHTNVDLLLARATQRFSGRYRDAFALLTTAAVDKDCQPQRVFGSLLYADYLDAAGGNPDAAAVQELQSFSKTTLAEHYSEKCCRAVLDERIAESCLATAGAAPKASVLSSFDFCALPTNWTGTAALTALADEVLLPPARHILTRRFSFADVEEMRRLERLRVDIQRRMVKDLLDDGKLLDDMLRTYAGVQGDSGGGALSRKERFITEARMSVTGAAVVGKPHAWPTVVSTAGDEH